MNNLFGSKKDYCQGQNKEMTPAQVANDYVERSQLENDPKILVKDDSI